MSRILLNKIRCKRCGDIIESKTRNDFVTCSCGAVAVDGGHDHLSRTGNREDWEELSILTQMSEAEICDRITHADKCSMQDVKEDWTFIVEWNTEHMKQYRLYFDGDGNKKVVVADL